MGCKHLKWVDKEEYSFWGCGLTEDGNSPDGRFEGCPREMEGTHEMYLGCDKYEEED